MEAISSDMDSLASPASRLAFCMRPSASFALSAFCLVIEAISSRDEVDSSRADACSLAPSARAWLAVEICSDAAATWTLPSTRPSMA